MNILVCGNFSGEANAVNGQAIKTRVLTDALTRELGGDRVDVLDTSIVFRRPFAFYAAARRKFTASSHVILMPGPRAVRILIPLFLRWRGRSSVRIHYVVIGGWLPRLLQTSPRLRDACQRLDGIHVESRGMAESLHDLGLRNGRVLPNFRAFNREMPPRVTAARRPLRLVFCARIFREKGIEEAVSAVEQLNARAGAPVAHLDVYGPLTEGYDRQFHRLIAASSATTYKGVLQPEEIHAALQPYDLLLFPTFYSDEGFPGTIIDAFVAGVPVLASDWKYNREFIQPGRTGALHRPQSADDLAEQLSRFVNAPELLTGMRPHCVDEAQKYHVEPVLRELLADLAGNARLTPDSVPA